MYKNLKYSWTHIIAFVALICVGYVTFVGLSYALDDGFFKPTLIMLGLILLLLIWFIGAQQLKGIDNDFRFDRCIWVERFLVFTAPFILVVCLIPFNHAMNVATKSDEIEKSFKNTIELSRKLFDDYKIYADERIANYNSFLKNLKQDKSLHPSIYQEIGFNGNNDDAKIDIEVKTLTRQLKDDYIVVDTLARNWIDKANQETSVWNVFLVGNVKEINSAITHWGDQLKSFSEVVLETEKSPRYNVMPYNVDEQHLKSIKQNFEKLSGVYQLKEDTFSVNFYTIILGIVIYLMLMFPYFIQGRNGVSTYTLFGRRYLDSGVGFSIKTNIESIPIETIRLDDSSKNTLSIDSGYENREERKEADSNQQLVEMSREERHRLRRERRKQRELNKQ